MLDVPQFLEMAMKGRASHPDLWELYATTMGQPNQMGAGIFSFLQRPLPHHFGKKAAKAATKRMAQKVTKKVIKRVAKKVSKKAAFGVATATGSCATQKALDSP